MDNEDIEKMIGHGEVGVYEGFIVNGLGKNRLSTGGIRPPSKTDRASLSVVTKSGIRVTVDFPIGMRVEFSSEGMRHFHEDLTAYAQSIEAMTEPEDDD